MANDYEDDFFNDDNRWKSYGTSSHTTHPEPKNSGNGHSQQDKRSVKSRDDAKSMAKSQTISRKESEHDDNDDSYETEEEEEEDNHKLQNSTTKRQTSTTNGAAKKASAKPANGRNAALETQLSYAPSNYDYEDTFVTDSADQNQSEQDHKRTPASKNKLLIKKPKLRQKADQSVLAEPGTVQRLLSAKNSKLHEHLNRIHELENALQQVQNENKLLKRLQKIQEKEITHFQHDQEEIPRLMQQHSAEMKAVKMILDKARVKHQKTWKRLLEVENLLREEKQKSEQLQQVVDSRDLKERYELDRKLSQAMDSIETKDKRILELETHLARLEKNMSRQVNSEKTKVKELQNLLEDLQNRNTKLEFSLKEKEKELSIRDIYRQRAIQEPKMQLVPIGASSSTASSPGFTGSTGNITAPNPRRPHPPPRRLPPPDAQQSRKTRKPPRPQPLPAATSNHNDSHRSDAQTVAVPPAAPELGNKGFFITQIDMDVAKPQPRADHSQNFESAVAAYSHSPRDPAAQKKHNNDPMRASEQRRREQEAEMDRQLAAERALQQELLRKQEQEKAEEERRKREEEIKRRQLLMGEADATRRRQLQKEEDDRRRLEEQLRQKQEAEREEQIRAEQKRKEAEANDRALRAALEAQRQQRADLEKREKRDWQDAEEKRIKDQVLKKTNSRKLEWLSPSPDDDADDDLLSFANTKRTNGVPARNTKKLDLLFSDDDDDAGFGGKTNNHKTPQAVDKLHNGLPTHDTKNNGNNAGGRPRAGAGSMAPFMLGDSRDIDGDFLFSDSIRTNNSKPPARGTANNNNNSKPGNQSKPNSFQQAHLFGVESPDAIML